MTPLDKLERFCYSKRANALRRALRATSAQARQSSEDEIAKYRDLAKVVRHCQRHGIDIDDDQNPHGLPPAEFVKGGQE